MKTVAALSSLAITGFVALAPQSAWALNTQSFVSYNGNSFDDCSYGTPCNDIGKAIASTVPGGTVICLNSGRYFSGTLTIINSITINCKGVVAAIRGSITVDAAGADKIVLEGLSIDGNGVANGVADSNGVTVKRAGFVYIIDSTIRNYSNAGVVVQSPTQDARVFIQNSTIQGSGSVGISVSPAIAGGRNILSVVGSLIDGNGPTSIKLDGPGAILGLQNSILNASPTSISLLNGAQAYSFGKTNSVNGTFTFTGVVPLN